jgi:hypothetical protein
MSVPLQPSALSPPPPLDIFSDIPVNVCDDWKSDGYNKKTE